MCGPCSSLDPLADLWQKGKPGARYALLVLTGINLFNYIDRYVPSATKEDIKASLDLSDFESSLPLSMFIIVYMITSPVFGHLSDKGWSKKRLIAFGVLLWSLATALGAVAKSFGLFLFARMLVGVGEAAYASITPVLMSNYFRPAQRNKALAFFYLAIPVGAAIGFAGGGALASAFGWRTAFLVCGLPGVGLSVLCLYIEEPEHGGMEDDLPSDAFEGVDTAGGGSYERAVTPPDGSPKSSPIVARRSTEAELASIVPLAIDENRRRASAIDQQGAVAVDATAPEFNRGPSQVDWLPALKTMFANKGYVYSLAGITLNAFASGGMADWLTSYLQREHGFSLDDASLYSGAMTVLGGIGGTIIGSWASDALRASGKFAAAEFLLMSGSAALSSVFAFAALFIKGSQSTVLVFLFLCQFFLWMYSGPANAVISCVPANVRTRAFAVSIFVQHALGDAIASPVIGTISDSTGSLATAVGIVPFFLAFSALAWGLGWVRVPDPEWQAMHANRERHCYACCGASD